VYRFFQCHQLAVNRFWFHVVGIAGKEIDCEPDELTRQEIAQSQASADSSRLTRQGSYPSFSTLNRSFPLLRGTSTVVGVVYSRPATVAVAAGGVDVTCTWTIRRS